MQRKRGRGSEGGDKSLFGSGLSPIADMPSPEAPEPRATEGQWPRASRKPRVVGSKEDTRLVEVEEEEVAEDKWPLDSKITRGLLKTEPVPARSGAASAADGWPWPKASAVKGELKSGAVPAIPVAAGVAKVPGPWPEASTAQGGLGVEAVSTKIPAAIREE